MNELSSTEFRRQYGKLTDATVVTANGRPVGIWTPIQVEARFLETLMRDPTDGSVRVPAHYDPTLTSQAQRDELLRKINRGK